MDSLSSNLLTRKYKDTISIYALTDPETEQVHYIGKSLHPESRFSSHLTDRAPSRKATWIKSLIRKGLKPQMRILEEVARDQGELREMYWMSYYQEQGHPLTNVRDNKLLELGRSERRRYETFSHHVQLTRRTYYSSEQSIRDTEIIKVRYGLSTDSDVIRLSLRMLAAADTEIELHVKKRTYKKRASTNNQQRLF